MPPPAIPGTLLSVPPAIVSRGSREGVAMLMDLDELVDHWTLLKDERATPTKEPTETAGADRDTSLLIGVTSADAAPSTASTPDSGRFGEYRVLDAFAQHDRHSGGPPGLLSC